MRQFLCQPTDGATAIDGTAPAFAFPPEWNLLPSRSEATLKGAVQRNRRASHPKTPTGCSRSVAAELSLALGGPRTEVTYECQLLNRPTVRLAQVKLLQYVDFIGSNVVTRTAGIGALQPLPNC